MDGTALIEADVPPTDDRAHMLTNWLSGAQHRIDPRFPPAIEALWEAESTADRVGALKLATFTACVTAILALPLLWMCLRDAHASIRVLWLFGGIPIFLVCHALLWTKQRVATQEWQVTASGLTAGVLLTLLMANSRYSQKSLYFGAVVALIMVGAVAGRLAFWPAAVLIGGLCEIFAAGILNIPVMDDLPGRALIPLLGITAVVALFGNRRLDIEMRRRFALALRERLSRQELGLRTAERGERAARDPLTGLANRRTYDSWLRAQWTRQAEHGAALGLVVIDVDYFGAYNDHYGYAAGDLSLQTIARCLRDQSRGTTDQVARIGGEAFAVLLPGLPLDRCGDIAERLRVAIAVADLPHLGAPPPRRITVSCGAASFEALPGVTQADLCAAADSALNAAKQAGRNRVCLADQPSPPAGAGGATPAHAQMPGRVQSG